MVGSFKVSFPTSRLKSRVLSVKAELAVRKSECLRLVGVAVLSLQAMDYRTLSRGGTTPDGRHWKALDPKTIKAKARRGRGKTSRRTKTGSGKALPVGDVSAIGIDTGLQQASGSPGFNAPGGGNIFEVAGDRVTVGYGREYSKYFDKTRKLFPDKLPLAWLTTLRDVVRQWAMGIVNRGLK
jgi:hypothetical protein